VRGFDRSRFIAGKINEAKDLLMKGK